MDDDKAKQKIIKAVEDYLDAEDEFAAEKLKATGQINTRKGQVLAKILTTISKLEITKEGFLAACRQERHVRSAKSVFAKIDDGEDLGLVGGYSRVALATGTMFDALYSDQEKGRMEGLAEESMADEDDEGAEIVSISEAAE